MEENKKRGGGRTETIGVNFTRDEAAAIRRQGNRRKSISAVMHSLIDRRKLAKLLDLDEEERARNN